jgi:antibiotic biosynthesis monooxygenase (ABM) superfamily enzyme
VLSPPPLLAVVTEGLIELSSSWDDPTDKSLISDDSEIIESLTELPRDLEDEDSPSGMSKPLRSTAHPAVPPSCKEIILIPSVLPVVAGMNSVVQPFERVIAVRWG